MIGQVGLRCRFCKNAPRKTLARQAVCFPLKRETIYESVRNYQRSHFKDCSSISQEIKAEYDRLTTQVGGGQKKSQKYVKAYYAEAATELGITDTRHGMVIDRFLINITGDPSTILQALMSADENPSLAETFWASYSSGKDKAIEMRKFEHIASDGSRLVIIAARNEPTLLVLTKDFPMVSDYDFLLFHQVIPFSLERRGHEADKFGFCCKHCAWRAGDGTIFQNTRADFPVDLNKLPDNGFFQRMLNHFMTCPDVPQEVKNAFDELKRLAWEHGTSPKRGSRKRFVEKIWERMKQYYGLKSDE
jgi:hypothetical protein